MKKKKPNKKPGRSRARKRNRGKTSPLEEQESLKASFDSEESLEYDLLDKVLAEQPSLFVGGRLQRTAVFKLPSKLGRVLDIE